MKPESFMPWKKIKGSLWLGTAALVIISIFVYLIHVGSFSYYGDDWYYMYDGLVGGGGIFVEMFRHLRPARGPLYEFLFGLFGTNPTPYHILLYLIRLSGGLAALWLFRILWPRQRSATFFMALLFLIYPGFLWWIQGFEYQPMVLSVGLQIFSIIFTLKAIQSNSRSAWILWMLGSLLSGWAYLAFVEYAIGMEVFRWLCVYLVISRASQETPVQKIIHTIRMVAIPLFIPILFLIWRVFLFDNERKAADISLQTGAILGSPVTLLWWLVHFFQSVLNVSGFAWALPFNENFYFLRLRDMVFAIGWMIVVIAISYLIHQLTHADDEHAPARNWQREAVSMGLLGVGAGVVPIIIANRVVTFDRFSHYALPASLAAVTFIVGLVFMLTGRRIRVAALSALIGLSVLTHHALATQTRNEETLINDFWHQVVWRAPALRTGTMLVVNYAGLNYGDGSDIVWGPANFIYYPEPQSRVPVTVPIAAARMEADTPRNILEAAQQDLTFIIVNDIHYDYDNLLVISMPSENSCIHILDAQWAELSIADTALVALSASRSRIENVLVDANLHTPPESVFGEEPAHGWCYYYQKAQLARQKANWAMVAKIQDEVTRLDLHPNDQVEWMPFLQSAAMLGDLKQVRRISTLINTEQLYKQQACQNLMAMDGLKDEVQDAVSALFCGGGEN